MVKQKRQLAIDRSSEKVFVCFQQITIISSGLVKQPTFLFFETIQIDIPTLTPDGVQAPLENFSLVVT
ncbi:MAG: hypothetical protein WAJ93_24400, partial [Candidatus Nitrosopolaris sp.]